MAKLPTGRSWDTKDYVSTLAALATGFSLVVASILSYVWLYPDLYERRGDNFVIANREQTIRQGGEVCYFIDLIKNYDTSVDISIAFQGADYRRIAPRGVDLPAGDYTGGNRVEVCYDVPEDLLPGRYKLQIRTVPVQKPWQFFDDELFFTESFDVEARGRL
ncbi:MAG: hypothetical protein WA991_03985 [Ornithinimicrobium sp.]